MAAGTTPVERQPAPGQSTDAGAVKTLADKSAQKAAWLVTTAKIFGALALVSLVVAGAFAYIPALSAAGIMSSFAIQGIAVGAGVSALGAGILYGVNRYLNRQPAEATKEQPKDADKA